MPIYTRAACACCRQQVWVVRESGDAAKATEVTSAPRCNRCKLKLSHVGQCIICFDASCELVKYGGADTNCPAHSSCRNCLESYIRCKLEAGVWNIRCPHPECRYVLNQSDLRKVIVCRGLSLGRIGSAGEALMRRYFELRYADYSVHLRELLRQQATAESAVVAVPGLAMAADHDSDTGRAQTSDAQDETASWSPDKASERSLSTSSGETSGMDSTGTSRCSGTPRSASTVTADIQESLAEQSVVEPASPLLTGEDTGFGSWALEACQACPRCMVIIRKEVGCDHISCPCGAEFCFGCGAPEGRGCVGCKRASKESRSKHQDLSQLARWLRVEKLIEF